MTTDVTRARELAFKPAKFYPLAFLRGKHATKAKAAIGYEDDVPRCSNCTQYRREETILLNSKPHWHPSRCVAHSIRVDAMAVCDTWAGADGARLEGKD